MKGMYSFLRTSALAAGVKTYFLEPGITSSEKRSSSRRSGRSRSWVMVLVFIGGFARREGKKEDMPDIVDGRE
jgi:hypothetical protein